MVLSHLREKCGEDHYYYSKAISSSLETTIHTARVEALFWMRCWVVSCVFISTCYVFAGKLNQQRLTFSFLLYPESQMYDSQNDARGHPADHGLY